MESFELNRIDQHEDLVNCNTYIAFAVHGSRASPQTARALTAYPEPVEGFFELDANQVLQVTSNP